MLVHFDAFSGFGGFALAARWTGEIQTVAFCEIEPYCCKVLNKNFHGIPILGDITKLGHADLDPIKPVDIFTGGFPCQPYSVAGKRRGDEDDRALWREMLRVIEILKPTWIVGENVANFVNMALDPMLTDLEGQGYEAIPLVIPAAGVGAPHLRKRCFIVGHTASTGILSVAMERITQQKDSYPVGTGAYDANRNGAGLAKRESIGGDDGTKQPSAIRVHCIGDAPDAKSTERERCRPTRPGWDGPTNGDWWSVEPELGRVANGVPRRVERLRGLGNAVVPQQVYPILQGIVDIELARIPQ